MKSIKMALMAGAAIAVSAAAAHADELSDLKAQIDSLNARMAAMETAPSVPSGYQLIAISEGTRVNTPGLDMNAREQFAYGNKATYISVMPTADAPAGTTITWSGYARAGFIASGSSTDVKTTTTNYVDANGDKLDKPTVTTKKVSDTNDTDWDVKARGQLRVTASTDTSVGAVGVDLRLRANFDGNGAADVYSDVAWGYWSVTPELTLGGGYSGSLGNVGYGFDGACTCYYTDNGDFAFNPGDTTQVRLSYASGPLSAAIALEDATWNNGLVGYNDNGGINQSDLGGSGELKYTGDTVNGEISGVYRAQSSDVNPDLDSLWQVGGGVAFNLGDIASLSLAAAVGHGPYAVTDSDGTITTNLPLVNDWWGVSGLGSFNLSDSVHAELAAAYKNRQGDDFSFKDADKNVSTVSGLDYDTYGFLGGVYYTPVDQLTIGVEGEWYTTSVDYSVNKRDAGGSLLSNRKVSDNPDNWTVDLVSVWRF